MGGILGSTGGNAPDVAGGTGRGGAASGLLGSLAGLGGALGQLSPVGSVLGGVGSIVGNWKKNKAAKKEQEAEQALMDRNRNALMSYQQDPATQALVSQMAGPQTSSQSGSSSNSNWSNMTGETGMEFGANEPEAARILEDMKAGVGRAQTLSDEEIRAGAQSMAADAAMRRGALQNRAARIGGVSASDLALGDPALAAANRAQSQLIADAKNRAYERGEQARTLYGKMFGDWRGKTKTKQQTRGGGTSNFAQQGTQSASPQAIQAALEFGAPIAEQRARRPAQ